jgi:tight adherence protein C
MLFFAQIDGLRLLCCLIAGGGCGVLVWWVLQALATEDDTQQDDEWRYDVNRINSLRRMDVLYRLFQPLIRVFAKLNRAALGDRLREVDREIQAAGLPRYWLPEEYLGRAELIAVLLAPAYLTASIMYQGLSGVITGLVLTGLTVWVLRARLRRLARDRLLSIKRRLPFLLDLLTLLMEAGSSFLQSLRQAVKEFEGHEIAVEFGRVLTDINMGKSRGEAFHNMRNRLGDEEISNIVGSILQSEQLGTPLSDIFRAQADVLRMKRSQRAESMAGEAGVQMLLPGVLVMIATVLIILGPFVLNYWYLGLGF